MFPSQPTRSVCWRRVARTMSPAARTWFGGVRLDLWQYSRAARHLVSFVQQPIVVQLGILAHDLNALSAYARRLTMSDRAGQRA